MSVARRFREIEPGVMRTSLKGPNVLSVHAYLVASGGVNVLVDSGFTQTVDDLLQSLEQSGLGLNDLDAVFLTHSHEDHMGGAVELGGRLDVPVYVWEGTTPAFSNYYTYYDRPDRWDTWFDGVLPEGPVREQVMAARRSRPNTGLSRGGDGTLPTVVGCAFGETIDVGALRFRCVDGRGHDSFHAAWLEEENGWLFSGDVVLSVPTPIMPALGDDIVRYRKTLHAWSGMAGAVEHVFPGHGSASTDLRELVARSQGFMEQTFDAIARAFDRAEIIDPSMIALELAQADPRSVRQAMFSALTNVDATLLELKELGIARRLADRRWERLSTMPEYTMLGGC